VVVQDTGFSEFLPVGQGLLAFSCLAEAVEGLRAIERDYGLHQTAAREVAQEYFAAPRVLTRLLEEVGLQ
jgi:hypothetical protein